MTTQVKEKELTQVFDIQFGEPDKYGESHGHIKMPLNHEESVIYFTAKINGGKEQRFHFNYWDAGTIGYARMKGNYAVCGRIANVSLDWSNAKAVESEPYRIIHAVGTIDGRGESGVGNIHLWITSKTNNP